MAACPDNPLDVEMLVAGEALLGEPQALVHKPEVLRAFNQLHAAIRADGALAAKLKDLTCRPRTDNLHALAGMADADSAATI